MFKKKKTKNPHRDLLRGPLNKTSSSNAGYTGSVPGQGTKSPHAAEQLSPQIVTKSPLTSMKTQRSQKQQQRQTKSSHRSTESKSLMVEPASYRFDHAQI